MTKTKINKKIAAIEQGLRYRVQIKNNPDKKMSLTNRMIYYKIPSISIAFINQGKIEWTKEYGKVTNNNSNQLVSTNTLFQAASISKLVTAIGILKLVQENKVSLDKNVNFYLKNWKVPESEFTTQEKVTIRRLLSHSAGISVSGFPGYTEGQTLPTLIQILDGIKPLANTESVRVEFIPGSKFRYSGGGISILQKIIEDQTNVDFAKWMEEQVLDALGMSSSSFEQPLPPNLTALAALAHSANGEQIGGNWHIYPEKAAAGLWTTPSDLARLAITIQSIYNDNLKNGILNSNLVKEMLSPQILIHGELYAGLGVFLYKSSDHFVFEHSGLNCGFSARLYMLSNKGQGVIMMTNGDINGWYLMEEVINSIADVCEWQNKEPVHKHHIFLDLQLYKNILGKFYSLTEPDEFAEIYIRDDQLFIKTHPCVPEFQLFLEASNQFFIREENQTINIRKNIEGTYELIITSHDDQIWGQSSHYLKC